MLVNKSSLNSAASRVIPGTLNSDISADFVPEHQLSVDVVASDMTTSSSHGSRDYNSRLSMPVIRGGINSNISDILEASGYGTETDIRVDEDYRFNLCGLFLLLLMLLIHSHSSAGRVPRS